MFRKLISSASLTTTLGCVVALANPVFYGPSPYLGPSDSPLLASGAICPDFVIEDFERGGISVAGLTASSGTVLFPGPSTDSVDIDADGINGSGNAGHSWWSGFPNGQQTITFTFSNLPSVAGIVWTDSFQPEVDFVTFEAFDGSNTSLGTIGPTLVGDGLFTGGTAEDQFFGISNAGGILSISLTMSSSHNFEMDHVQWGCSVPEPASVSLLAAGMLALLRRR
ncbi:MAG: PEP-CTERM sorting domain-containing protein [Phycisphaerae bacterium]